VNSSHTSEARGVPVSFVVYPPRRAAPRPSACGTYVSATSNDAIAEYVTVCFEEQKSGVKDDSRSQRLNNAPLLCPCRRLRRAVRWVISTVPDWTGDTLLCTVRSGTTSNTINNTFTKQLLRSMGVTQPSVFTPMRLATAQSDLAQRWPFS
jgi:hypothetical protein